MKLLKDWISFEFKLSWYLCIRSQKYDDDECPIDEKVQFAEASDLNWNHY